MFRVIQSGMFGQAYMMLGERVLFLSVIVSSQLDMPTCLSHRSPVVLVMAVFQIIVSCYILASPTREPLSIDDIQVCMNHDTL